MTGSAPPPKSPKPPTHPSDSSMIFRFINRLVTLLYWIAIPIVLVLVGLSVYAAYLGSFDSVGTGELYVVMITQLFEVFADIWSVVAPIILVVIIGALLRWLVFTPDGGGLSAQIRRTLKDVPSLIAILVITVVSLTPLLRMAIPEPLGNIALVIVGFYFGREKRLPDTIEETREKGAEKMPETPGST